MPVNSATKIINRPRSITADKDGKLQYLYNYVARTFFHAESTTTVPEGRHQRRYEFEVTGEADILKGKGVPGVVSFILTANWLGKLKCMSPIQSCSV